MGGIKTKGRGPDKKKRKSRKTTQRKSEPAESEVTKPDILRGIIDVVSKKIKKEQHENWSLDIRPTKKKPLLGRHVFKSESTVEIDLDEL